MTAARILVDPRINFGQPYTERRGISTAVIRSRWLAGECTATLAEDYDFTAEMVDAALAFERWCRRRGRYDAPYAERLARKAKDPDGFPRQVWPRKGDARDA